MSGISRTVFYQHIKNLNKRLEEDKANFFSDIDLILGYFMGINVEDPVLSTSIDSPSIKISQRWLGNLFWSGLTATIDSSGKLSVSYCPYYYPMICGTCLDGYTDLHLSEYDLKAILGVVELTKIWVKYFQRIINEFAYYSLEKFSPRNTPEIVYIYPHPETNFYLKGEESKNIIDYILTEGLSWIKDIQENYTSKSGYTVGVWRKKENFLKKVISNDSSIHLWSTVSSNNRKIYLKHQLLQEPVWGDFVNRGSSPEKDTVVYQRVLSYNDIRRNRKSTDYE